eukprot:SAG22_NODE_205_length_15308_cov_20.539023_19_plen_239_part_00
MCGVLQTLVDRYIIAERNNDPEYGAPGPGCYPGTSSWPAPSSHPLPPWFVFLDRADTERALSALFTPSRRKGKEPWAPEWDRSAVNASYLLEPSRCVRACVGPQASNTRLHGGGMHFTTLRQQAVVFVCPFCACTRASQPSAAAAACLPVRRWTPQYVQFSPMPVMGFHITLFYYYCDFALALLFILIYLDTMYMVVSTFIAEVSACVGSRWVEAQSTSESESTNGWSLSLSLPMLAA